MPKIDLHTHTTASDGVFAPAELVQRAAQVGIGILGIADHDTISGLPGASLAAKQFNIQLIPGVEFCIDIDCMEVHMLGYFFDPEHPELLEKLEHLHAERLGRGKQVVTKLRDMGMPLDWAQVEHLAAGGSVGRPHVAKALLQGGFVQSIDQAFEKYLGYGASAYVEHNKLTPGDCIALIHKAGGIAVLAHPTWLREPEVLLPSLIKVGLDGIEVYYGDYTPDIVSWLEGLADYYSLVRTGGSDYHGTGSERHSELGGSVNFPYEHFLELENYVKSLRERTQSAEEQHIKEADNR